MTISAEERARPHRVQLRRIKGWRMPPNTISVGQGPWRELFRAHEFLARSSVGAIEYFAETCAVSPALQADADSLRGKNLACWCPLDQPCHADVLLELANAPTNPLTTLSGRG